MPSPSIAWRPAIGGGDQIWVVMASPQDGSILSYWADVPDPMVSLPQWSFSQIGGPGSAGEGYASLAIAFGPLESVHVAAPGPNGVVYYRYYSRYYLSLKRPPDPWVPQNINNDPASSVGGIAVMPDNQVFILTVSGGSQLTGYLGVSGTPFVPIPIGPASPGTLTLQAAMAVGPASSSQVQVNVIALQEQQTQSGTLTFLTYFSSSYEPGSGFGPWQPTQIPAVTAPGNMQPSAYYNTSIALGPDGEVIVGASLVTPLGIQSGIYNGFTYWVLPNPGSSWNPVSAFSLNPTSSAAVAVDASGMAHAISFFRDHLATQPSPLPINRAPTLQDLTLPLGGTETAEPPLVLDSFYGPDPLGWSQLIWTENSVSVTPTSEGVPAYQPEDVVGITVRPSGEIDVAFWNYPLSELVCFSLPLASSTWNFSGLVAAPPFGG